MYSLLTLWGAKAMQLLYNEQTSAVGPGGANRLTNVLGGSAAEDKTNNLAGTPGWDELQAQGKVTNWAGLSQPGPPSGHGWCYDAADLQGLMFVQSNKWLDQLQLYLTGTSAASLDVLHRFFQYDSLAVKFTQYAQIAFNGLALVNGFNSFNQQNLLLPEMQFPTNRTFFYVDMWANLHTSPGGTLAVVQNTGAGGVPNTYMQAPDPVTIYQHIDYINLIGYAGVPYYKYQSKPPPRVESDEVTHGSPIYPTCLFDAKFGSYTDSVNVQMNYTGPGDWPVLSIYRIGSGGQEDLILQVSDGALYTVPKSGYLGWHYHEYDGAPLVVVRSHEPKVFDLLIQSILP
jgi:hypothetical protein